VDGLYVKKELYTARMQTKKHPDAEISFFWEVCGRPSWFH